MPYEDPDTRFPLTFHPFNDALNKDRDVMMAIISPRAIPVNFSGSGKASNLTYEFYNPSALARQLALSQLPIALCYADVIKPRETITSNLEWIRIAQLPPNADTNVDLLAWIPALFITQTYKQWWEEWKEHLFCRSALTYRGIIDPKYKVPDNTVRILIDVSIPSFPFSIGNLLSSFYSGRWYAIISQQMWQADRTPSIGPDLFDRQQRSNLGHFNAPGCASQENHHQADENIPVGSCHYFVTSLQGKFSNSSTYTDSILILTQFFRTHQLAWELHR